MNKTTGTLADLTTQLNAAITEVGAPVAAADGSLSGATTALNALLAWYSQPLPAATGTLASAADTYNLLTDIYLYIYYWFQVGYGVVGTSRVGWIAGKLETVTDYSQVAGLHKRPAVLVKDRS